MDRYCERYAKLGAEQCGRKPTRQSRMSVDDVHRAFVVQSPHRLQNSREQKRARHRQAKISWHRKETFSKDWNQALGSKSTMAIERLYRDYRASHA
jgi:hypothetical protein